MKTGRRVANTGANVSAWCDKTGEGSSMYDVCDDCALTLENDPHAFDAQLRPYNGDPVGEDGWEGDIDHPPYDDQNPPYRCKVCGVELCDYTGPSSFWATLGR